MMSLSRNFGGLVLGCIDADVYKNSITDRGLSSWRFLGKDLQELSTYAPLQTILGKSTIAAQKNKKLKTV